MPLNYEQPITKKIPIIQKVGSLFLRLLVLIRPETVLGVFLIAGILLAFLRTQSIGFYIVFGIFIVGYFAERIIITVWKRKSSLKSSTK